jgi:hypothetical protein
MPIFDLLSTSSLPSADLTIADATLANYPVIPVSPDSMIGSAMWKMVGYATAAILVWSYLKTRSKGE